MNYVSGAYALETFDLTLVALSVETYDSDLAYTL